MYVQQVRGVLAECICKPEVSVADLETGTIPTCRAVNVELLKKGSSGSSSTTMISVCQWHSEAGESERSLGMIAMDGMWRSSLDPCVG